MLIKKCNYHSYTSIINTGGELEEDCSASKYRRLSRLQTSIGQPEKRREQVLPWVCIICKKVKYKVDKDKTRNVERLKKVETLTAGKLLEAARLKERQDILVHLEGTGRDLPALEPHYHHSCYMDLTRFLTKPAKNLEELSRHYTKAYNKFCDTVVVPQILKEKRILLLQSLKESFVKMVKEVEGIDTSYRSSNLKKRLSNTYPQLQFTYDTTKGYIVYSGAISAADLVKDHIGQMSTDLSSEEDEPDELDEESQLHMRSYNQDDMQNKAAVH